MHFLNYFLLLIFLFIKFNSCLSYLNLPFHTGLINDYNNHQKPSYKYVKNLLNNQSVNIHQSLPLISSNLNQQNKLDNNLKIYSNDQSNYLNKLSKNEKYENHAFPILSNLPSRFNNLRKHYNNLKNNKFKQQIKLKKNLNNDYHQIMPETCPESSFSKVNLDLNSKAYLAPILFIGKLTSLSEDYNGQVSATFQVSKVIKSTTVNVFSQFTKKIHQVPIILKKGHQAVIHFVRMFGDRFKPPHCAVYMNSSSIGALRLDQKYFVYAAPPLSSLQEIHKHSFGSVIYTVNPIQSINATTNETTSNVELENLVWFNNNYLPIKPNQLALNKTYNFNNSLQIASNSSPFSGQFIIHYLSAFTSPEPFNKKIYKSFSKSICKKCIKKPEVQGLNGDVHIRVKSRLSLRCKIFGNPQPWVEWYRNGKKLRNKGRFIIKNNKKLSKLDINVIESSDSGYYECRAYNVANKSPSIAKTRVIVVLVNKQKEIIKKKNFTNINRVTTTPANLWPLIGQLCPINNYCLNNGICTFFENVYEYVCQCADGFQGHRCENKDIYAFKKDDCRCSAGYKGVRCEEKDISINNLMNKPKSYSSYKSFDLIYNRR